jgi:hypothetical protein
MSSGKDLRQSSDSEHIVGCADQVGMHLHPCAPPAALAQIADCLDPVEVLLDALADSLTDCVPGWRVVHASSVEPPGRNRFCVTWGLTWSSRRQETKWRVS